MALIVVSTAAGRPPARLGREGLAKSLPVLLEELGIETSTIAVPKVLKTETFAFSSRASASASAMPLPTTTTSMSVEGRRR